MIYVTVGSSIGGAEFDRLIKKIDDIAPHFEEEFIVQLGASKYVPKNVRWIQYVPYGESLDYFKNARLIIGHCGSGTIINALSFGKPLIAVPRLVKFYENSDDHQLQIAQRLGEKGFVEVVYDVENLESAVRRVLEKGKRALEGETSSWRNALIKKLKDFVNRCA
jgi:UDP-N-acetylglucosamine transferase subunit ALG13